MFWKKLFESLDKRLDEKKTLDKIGKELCDSDILTDEFKINKLNLGCGGNYIPGYIGVDKKKDGIMDIFHYYVIHDLEMPYLPFKDKSFSFIMLKSTIAHVRKAKNLLNECKRVASQGIGIMECGSQCKKNKKKYNKSKLILLTNDPIIQKECIEEYKKWIDNAAMHQELNKRDHTRYVKNYPFEITNEFNPFRTS